LNISQGSERVHELEAKILTLEAKLKQVSGALEEAQAEESAPPIGEPEVVSMQDWYIRRTIEGQEVKLENLTGKLEELENLVSKIAIGGLRSLEFQNEAFVRLLIEKGVITEEEISDAVQRVLVELESMMRAQQEGMENPDANAPAPV